ncbi:MAG: alpha/beta hydrolase [Actinocatenispora sp.]
MRSTERRRTGRKRTGVLVVLSAAVGGVVGVTVLLGVAKFSASPAVFVTAGLLALLAVNAAGTWWATRRRTRRGRRQVVTISAAVVALCYLVATLVPMNGSVSSPAPVAGQRTVALPTGSHLTYVRIPARGTPRPTPVIFVHGGPGTPDLRGDSRYFGQLAAAGFDVVVYDQFGSAGSGRAASPEAYTMDRAVADLDALRRHLGADKVDLIGHSYGGRLAATYLSRHPGHVARAVFSSPSDLDPKAGGDSTLPVLTGRQRVATISALARPRVLLAYNLLQVNPDAAHNLVGDAEMDGDFEAVYDKSRPALHCPGQDPGPALRGLGFYSNQYSQSPVRANTVDPRPALARTTVPTLVVKGSCDYLSWSSATGYLESIPHSELYYLKGAGHNAYQDRPGEYLAEVRAFLTGRALPAAPYRGTALPHDYRVRP